MNKYIVPFPEVVRIEPSAACNLKCIHCPTGTVKMRRGVMTEATFDLVLKQLAGKRIRVAVLYQGGEPLLNKRFPSMIRRVKALGIPFVKTVSNGMLLTDAIMESLIGSGLDLIEFSLDGENKEENDFIRRGSKFETVIDNVKRFIALKKKHGVKLPRITICSTSFLPAGTSGPDPVCKVPGFIVKEFGSETEIDFKTTWAYVWPDLPIQENVFSADPGGGATNYCDHVHDYINVRWNGDVVPCCYDLTSKLVLGNVRQDSLETIWNNPYYQELRRSIDKMEFNELCKNCTVVNPGMHLRLKRTVKTK
jgi:radical SAM protein with 4Fe4S-binding SPASM domain